MVPGMEGCHWPFRKIQSDQWPHLMGLLLGGLWIATGNLLVPIVAHAVYDFLALVWLVKFEGPQEDSGSGQ